MSARVFHYRFPQWLALEKRFEIACEPGAARKFCVRLWSEADDKFIGYGPSIATAAKRARAARSQLSTTQPSTSR